MASFTKRGSKWQYTVSRMVDRKSKPIRKSGFRTKKEAQIAATEVEAGIQKGIIPHLKFEPFDEYFETWLSTFKTDIANNTLQRYLNTIETIKNYFGGKPIQEINKRAYQTFLNDYGKNHAQATTRKLNTHIRACVRDAIDEGIIKIDFTRGAVATGKAGKKKSDKHLGFEESKRLLNIVFEQLDKSLSQYVILLALTSGMRFAEMVGLKREDFDFVNNTISINKTWGYVSKMHPGWGFTKNEQSIRVIKMDPKTMNEFNKLFKRTPENIKKLVFYSPLSKYHVISNGGVNKLLATLLSELKIKQMSIHNMRHTHASILLYQGVSIYYVSKRLGHGDIETTLNTYTHVIKELEERDQQKSVDVFKEMIV